jgi:hypothetical protein
MLEVYIIESVGTASGHRRRPLEIALGHRASGMKLMATLIHALKTRGRCYGLQTRYDGGGIANVTIIGVS